MMKFIPSCFILVLLTTHVLFSQNNPSIFLGEKTYVNIEHLPYYKWIPDGHISVLPDGEGKYVMYWSEFANSRTSGDTQFPESQKTLDPVEPVFGGRVGNEGPSNGYNDGGSWLMSVYRHNGDTLIGFYHGESHWYPRNGDYTAWKSTCLAYSYDNGYTWEDQGPIVTSNTPKPDERTWGGSGDCCVIWDPVNQRWNCYHQEHNIRLAVSYDPLGAPGTWKKYYNGEFHEEGLGGKSTPLTNLTQVPGTNPSVHWNTYYNKWIMAYHSWTGAIYISLSMDGVNWDSPQKIIPKESYNAAYANIIGETDVKAGRLARIYYGEFYSSGRKMAARDILFDSTGYDYGQLAKPWEAQNIGDYNFTGKAGLQDNVITITGTTNSFLQEKDAFYYMYQGVTGNGEISSRLTFQTDINNKAYSGLMLRSTTATDSKFISISRKSSTDSLEIMYRDSEGHKSLTQKFPASKSWFKIQKDQDVINLFDSEFGDSWDLLFSLPLELPDEFLAGLFNTSHDENIFCTSKFENTEVNFRNVGRERFLPAEIVIPNPVGNKLFIKSQFEMNSLAYMLTDMSGKIYGNGVLEGTYTELDISDLPSGRYYVIQIFEGHSYLFAEKIYKK